MMVMEIWIYLLVAELYQVNIRWRRNHIFCKMMAEIYRLLLADDVATSDSDYLVFETKTHANSYFVRPEMYRLLSDVLLQTLRLSAARVWSPAVEAAISSRLNALTTAIDSALIKNGCATALGNNID